MRYSALLTLMSLVVVLTFRWRAEISASRLVGRLHSIVSTPCTVLALVHSDAANQRERHAVRTAWAQHSSDAIEAQKARARNFFVVPIVDSGSEVSTQVDLERVEYGDIIVVPRAANEATEILAAMSWAAGLATVRGVAAPPHGWVHALITRDSTLVNTPYLVADLGTRPSSHFIMGSFGRSKSKKQRAAKEANKGPVPDESAFVVSRDVVATIVHTSHQVALLPMVGGIGANFAAWTKPMDLTRQHHDGFIVSQTSKFLRKSICRLGSYFSIANVDVATAVEKLAKCALPTSTGAWLIPSSGYRWDLDTSLAKALSHVMRGASVGDFGAGGGEYCKYFERQNEVHSALCFDGVKDVAKITAGLVRSVDFARPLELGAQFDWVIAINVMEYIPGSLQPILLDNMHRHNRQGIVLVMDTTSSALTPPLDGGERSAVPSLTMKEVQRIMEALHYRRDSTSENFLTNAAPHRRGTVLVFRRVKQSQKQGGGVRGKQQSKGAGESGGEGVVARETTADGQE